MAEQLLVTAGNTGYICRWGGDEFTGILPGRADEVKKSLEIMSTRLSGIMIDDQFNITISAGIINIKNTEEGKDIDGLVMLADKALYNAKESGRNQVCVG